MEDERGSTGKDPAIELGELPGDSLMQLLGGDLSSREMDDASKAAMLVITARAKGSNLPIRDAARMFNVKPRKVLKALERLKREGYYVRLTPERLITSLLNRMFVLNDAERNAIMDRAVQILREVYGRTSKSPLSLAAASIEVACEELGHDMPASFIASAAGITLSALRSAKRLILELTRGVKEGGG